ncbi:MAG TPA: alpha-amylase family glycosyl hydrolase [Parafilimonas sp.]|nr:alpha-amylase family glycosyl hydrolase [Parafilimonas sp.]
MDIKQSDWINAVNVYEVNIRQYTYEGTFAAFAKHIPRLKEMGVKILWLMPITPISLQERQGTLGSYYACSDYVSINPEFGTLDDFKALIKEAHDAGMLLIIDWVANHTGYDHHWTKEHSDWYEHDDAGNFVEKHGWKDVIDLNYDNKDLRAEMIRCMQYWINECNIDGFRCDMAHLVPLDFWIAAKEQCEKIKPLFWLAECEVPEYHKVFNATYAWKWMHITERIAKQMASIKDMVDVLKSYNDYPAGALKLFFTANHDENTWNGTEYEKYGDLAKAFAIFSITWMGIPLIYSGQELPNLKRLKFFDKDEIEWTDKEPALQDFYHRLLDLKSNNAALHITGNTETLSTDYNENIFAFLRTNGKERVLVILNLSNRDKLQFHLEHPLLEGTFQNVFSDIQYKLGAVQTFELQAYEYIVSFAV